MKLEFTCFLVIQFFGPICTGASLAQETSTSSVKGPRVVIEGERGSRQLVFYDEEGAYSNRIPAPQYEIHYESEGKVHTRLGDWKDEVEIKRKYKIKWSKFIEAKTSEDGSTAVVDRIRFETAINIMSSTRTVYDASGREIWTSNDPAIARAGKFNLSGTGHRIASFECVKVNQYRDCEQLKGVWAVTRTKEGKELLRLGPYPEMATLTMTRNGKYGYVTAGAGYANGLPFDPTLVFFSVDSKKSFVCDPKVEKSGTASVTEDGRAQIKTLPKCPPAKVVDGKWVDTGPCVGGGDLIWARRIDE